MKISLEQEITYNFESVGKARCPECGSALFHVDDYNDAMQDGLQSDITVECKGCGHSYDIAVKCYVWYGETNDERILFDKEK